MPVVENRLEKVNRKSLKSWNNKICLCFAFFAQRWDYQILCLLGFGQGPGLTNKNLVFAG